jgi:histone-lysine N-methyltransferase SETMAR
MQDHVSLDEIKLLQLGWDVLPHLPYSQDIAPTDFNLFRKVLMIKTSIPWMT